MEPFQAGRAPNDLRARPEVEPVATPRPSRPGIRPRHAAPFVSSVTGRDLLPQRS